MTNKMQLFRIIYYSLAVLHVSSDNFVHHQEPLWLIVVIILYNNTLLIYLSLTHKHDKVKDRQRQIKVHSRTGREGPKGE